MNNKDFMNLLELVNELTPAQKRCLITKTRSSFYNGEVAPDINEVLTSDELDALLSAVSYKKSS
ncbi:hypothetical protein ACOMICROBIO_LMKGKHOH_05296 [Vibrio sp. B1FIG11]|uniref:hypothetical protein n=1 Tax=Vibrio sp. B1FIG11 TaxID=2751177 RepID=UPI001AF5D1C5|nr:hypothetical protein [Vibrio sp. B1FIG11]CAD7824652.1 hypothetical protein ACOMICROBIO_LMKGKHOH_05296 [Vibrio sp. B1FIG11]CAE6953201.1 hypothetical protein ACOMICROBIO_LMKGKHOH_05296 [Vibrio sp. B1FIG11]